MCIRDRNNSSNVDSDGDGISDELETIVAVKAPNWVDDFDGDGIADASDPNSMTPDFPMITTWRVGDPGFGDGDNTITLPFRTGFAYNATVDWGDGNSDVITAWDQLETTHTYAAAGDYTVTISGTAEAWFFNNAGDKDKIISVTQLGELGWTNFENAFFGCTNLATFTPGITDTSSVTNMKSMFFGASSLTSLDLSSFNTCLLYTSPSPRDATLSRMPSSA